MFSPCTIHTWHLFVFALTFLSRCGVWPKHSLLKKGRGHAKVEKGMGVGPVAILWFTSLPVY